MPTPWWARITPDYYDKPSGLAKSVKPRARSMAAVIHDTRLKDEPQIAAAFLNAGVPFAVAQRADIKTRIAKAAMEQAIMQQQGMPEKVSLEGKITNEGRRVAFKDASDALFKPTPMGGDNSFIFGGVPNPFTIADEGQSTAKQTAVGLGAVVNAVFSPLTVPVAMAQANKASLQLAPGETFVDKFRTSMAAALDARKTGKSAEEAGRSLEWFTDPLRKTGLNTYGEGFNQVVGLEHMSPTQIEDMKKAGYNPESFFDRYGWYYSSMGAGPKAVADSDVTYFKQEYDPIQVDAVREILTSNVFADNKFEALSPQAIEYLQKVQGGDPVANELFERMSTSATLHLGSQISDAFGMPRGTTGANVVSVLGDLAMYWYADPIAGAMRLGNFAKNVHRSVPAGDIMAAEAKLLALKVPGKIGSGPATVQGKAMDELIDISDRLVRLQQAKFAPDAAGREMAKKAMRNFSGDFDKFRIRHPEAIGQVGVVAQIIAGKLDSLVPKSAMEIERDARLLARGERVDPWHRVTKGASPKYLARDGAGKASQESLDYARAELVKRIGMYWWTEALATGRPLINGRMLLPGQVAVNRVIRGAIAPYRDAMLGRLRLRKAWDQTKGLVVHFDGDFGKATDQFIGHTAGVFTKDNYTSRLGSTFERILRNFDMTFSGRHLSWHHPDGVETFRRFAVKYFGRQEAYLITAKFAAGGPAERKALWKQFAEGMAQAANFKSTPMATALTDLLTRGNIPRILDQHGRETNRFGPDGHEVYTAERADNYIRIGDEDVAAGVWAYQMSDGITLPHQRLINAYQKRTGLLSAITGMFNSRLISAPTSVWKVGKVANPPNMLRQTLELYALSTGEQGLKFLKEARRARRVVLAEDLAQKINRNTLSKAATHVMENAYTRDHQMLEQFARSGDWHSYRQLLAAIVQSTGGSEKLARALSQMADGVPFANLIRTGPGKAALAFSPLVDSLRRVRLEWVKRTGGSRELLSPEWRRYVNQEYVESITASAMDEIGYAADRALQVDSGARAADELAAAGRFGMGGKPVNLTPNSYDWMGVVGDKGARQWFDELESRLYANAGGGDVLRAVAIEARNKTGHSAAEVLNHSQVQAARGITPDLAYPAGVNTAREIAIHLIKSDPRGWVIRDNAMRLAYHDGMRINNPAMWDAAVEKLADAQLRDAARHLGAHGFDDTGKPLFSQEYGPLLDKLALGGHPTVRDLMTIPNRVRPTSISTPLYIPVGRGPTRQWVANGAAKLYAFTVARPLQRLAITPAFIANRSIAFRELEPAAAEMMNRGLSAGQAASLLELTASRYAVNATFRYTDNTMERSFFSESVDNFFMFQRAAEDFIRRFMKVTSANPAILSKAYLLMEAAQHSGIVYAGPPDPDDDGDNPTRHLTFTFPGSGLLAQAFAEAGRALGLGDTPLIETALYSSMSSQVRYVNPSLTNPFGFSTSPMIGFPLRLIRTWFPETYTPITNTLARIEGGGERFFAEQTWWQSIMPTPLARLVPVIAQDDAEGQLASALRNAMVYFTAAGKMPGPDATPDEIEEANEAMMTMATNQMVWRAIVGNISPWAPQFNEPEGLGLPEVNAFDMARGIRSIRGEWFQLLGEQSEIHGSYDGFGHAMAKWLERYPLGKSILNADAFMEGTTRAPGIAEEAGSFSSGPSTTQWLMENKDWVLQNKSIAYYLLPQFNEENFSAMGQRQQLVTELREHKDGAEFYADLRYRIGTREFWDRLKLRDQQLARGGRPASKIHTEFNEWVREWRATHPATAAEMDRRQDPQYVHGTLAPALEALATGRSASVPRGVPLDKAKAVYEHYRKYREQYNKTKVGDKGLYDRRDLNKAYREEGDKLFLGTEVEELWKAMDIYEGD